MPVLLGLFAPVAARPMGYFLRFATIRVLELPSMILEFAVLAIPSVRFAQPLQLFVHSVLLLRLLRIWVVVLAWLAAQEVPTAQPPLPIFAWVATQNAVNVQVQLQLNAVPAQHLSTKHFYQALNALWAQVAPLQPSLTLPIINAIHVLPIAMCVPRPLSARPAAQPMVYLLQLAIIPVLEPPSWTLELAHHAIWNVQLARAP